MEETDLVSHSVYPSCHYAQPRPYKQVERDMNSNLALQKLLYFNWFYSILFLYVMAVQYLYKMVVLYSEVANIVRYIVLVFWALLESVRLQNGVNGNIREWFPELISFLLMSLINLVMLGVMGLYGQVLPLEKSALGVQLVFVLSEVVAIVLALLRLGKSSSALFYLKCHTYEKNKKSKKPYSNPSAYQPLPEHDM